MFFVISLLCTVSVGIHGAILPQVLPSTPITNQARISKQNNNNIARELPDQPIGIVEQTFLPQVDGSFVYSFESENGIKQQASGERKPIGEDGADVIVMKGSYEFIGADGQIYTVDWEADENGFRPSAPHLPLSVPIPFPEQQAAVDAQLRFAAEEVEQARQGKSSSIETPVLARQIFKRPPHVVQPQAVFEDY